MEKSINILIIEDHPLVIEMYKNILRDISTASNDFIFNISSATCCESANYKINKYSTLNTLDLVLLDLRLPASNDGKVTSGDDLGYKIRDSFPNCKIIVITSLNDNFRLNTILKRLNPDGLLLKSDISGKALKNAIAAVLDDKPYYSITVLKLLRKQISTDIVLEDIDRQILYHLSLGTKTKDLPTIINLSLGGVERRKRKLKELFKLENANDNALLKTARKNGFI